TQLNSNLVTIGGFLAVDGQNGTGQGVFDMNDNSPLSVAGNFATVNGGTLTMVFGEQLTVGGAVTFAGGDEAGPVTSGLIQVAGDFAQSANATAFRPDANNFTVEFNGTGLQQVSFANPGNGAASSYFGNLAVSTTVGLGGFSMQSNVFALGQLSVPEAIAA